MNGRLDPMGTGVIDDRRLGSANVTGDTDDINCDVSGIRGEAAQMLADEIPPTMSQEVQADTVVTPIDVQAQDVCEKEIIDILKSVKDNHNADMDGDKDGSDMTAAENYGPRRSTRVRMGVSLSEYVHNVWIKKANMKFESLVTSTSDHLEL